MATSRRRRPAETFAEQSLGLAWGAWVELGVSGWASTHGSWAIDPEPLIIFTASLGDADPRLRDEATDWCIRNWRFVSKARLKNILRQQPEEVVESFGELAATVGAHAGITWPSATNSRPYTVTGRSTLPPLDRPSLVWLRLRAMFGLSARTEILRYFLSRDRSGASVATLASSTGYTKRNVAEACEALEHAGVLSVRSIGNRFSYSLARRVALERFVGDVADVRPRWVALLDVTRELVDLERQAQVATQRTLAVRSKQTLRRIEDDLADLDIDKPSGDVRGEDLWTAVRALGMEHLGAWSVGDWPDRTEADGGQAEAVVRRLRSRAP